MTMKRREKEKTHDDRQYIAAVRCCFFHSLLMNFRIAKRKEKKKQHQPFGKNGD